MKINDHFREIRSTHRARKQELLQQGKSFCPSCLTEGEEETGCPDCPGYWFSRDGVDGASDDDFRGMNPYDGAGYVVDKLTPDDIAYAKDPARGPGTGFAALHDLMDANLLLPFADIESISNPAYLQFCNQVIREVDYLLLKETRIMFYVEGGTYTKEEMLTQNAEDEEALDFINTAQVGESFPAVIACSRVS